jgi:hypothetical protein
MAAGQSVLKAQNLGDGYGFLGQASNGYGVYGISNSSHGVYGKGSGVGLDDSGVLAEATNASGVALWAHSKSTDTTLVSSNDGSGPLFKGFGGDSGEHEFIILNDGTVQQTRTASGLAKAGARVMCSNSTSAVEFSFNNVAGTITITNGASAGRCQIDFGFQIDDRFILTAAGGYSAPRGASRYPVSSTKIECFRWDDSGAGVGGAIYIVIF